MRRLPVRPAIFITAWLALFAGATATTLAGPPLSDVFYAPPLVALMLLQLSWTGQAARVAAEVLAAQGQVRRARSLDLATLVLFVTAAAGHIAFLVALPQGLSTPAPMVPLLVFAVVAGALGAFALDTVAASAISAAERVLGVGSPHVLGTFIQFLYLPLAAPFLHRRLKRLQEAGSAPGP